MTARRARTVSSLSLIVGAAALAAAAFAPWWRRIYDDPLTGPLTVTLTGAQVWSALVPVALVVTAGWGAASLSAAMLRRAIGVTLGLVGLTAVIALAGALGEPPIDGFANQLSRPAEPVTAAELVVTAPAAGFLGAALIIVGAVLMAAIRPPARRAAQSYGSPAAKRASARGTSGGAADGADLWHALDDGVDPTDGAEHVADDRAVKAPAEDRYDEST